MSANVENMMSVREKPWHGLGTVVETAPTSAEAITLGGLDWKVIPEKLFLPDGTETPLTANVRETDHQFYGAVTDRYKIVQNIEAFDFIDQLAKDGLVRYETVGSLAYGKRVFMTVKLNETRSILGDDFENYLVLTNAHDGKGAVRVIVTPVRVVCQNTLSLSIREATNSWSIKHSGDVVSKMAVAKETIIHTIGYLDSLEEEAEKYQQIKVSTFDFQAMLDNMFPIESDASKTVVRNMESMKMAVEDAYIQSDVVKFNGTGWGVLNAVSDVVGHRQPMRHTDSFQESRFEQVVGGHKLLLQAQELILQTA